VDTSRQRLGVNVSNVLDRRGIVGARNLKLPVDTIVDE